MSFATNSVTRGREGTSSAVICLANTHTESRASSPAAELPPREGQGLGPREALKGSPIARASARGW